jgi:hypothetical protein
MYVFACACSCVGMHAFTYITHIRSFSLQVRPLAGKQHNRGLCNRKVLPCTYCRCAKVMVCMSARIYMYVCKCIHIKPKLNVDVSLERLEIWNCGEEISPYIKGKLARRLMWYLEKIGYAAPVNLLRQGCPLCACACVYVNLQVPRLFTELHVCAHAHLTLTHLTHAHTCTNALARKECTYAHTWPIHIEPHAHTYILRVHTHQDLFLCTWAHQTYKISRHRLLLTWICAGNKKMQAHVCVVHLLFVTLRKHVLQFLQESSHHRADLTSC